MLRWTCPIKNFTGFYPKKESQPSCWIKRKIIFLRFSREFGHFAQLFHLWRHQDPPVMLFTVRLQPKTSLFLSRTWVAVWLLQTPAPSTCHWCHAHCQAPVDSKLFLYLIFSFIQIFILFIVFLTIVYVTLQQSNTRPHLKGTLRPLSIFYRDSRYNTLWPSPE